MLKVLKRDGWKLLVVLLLAGCLDMLSDASFLRGLWVGIYSGVVLLALFAFLTYFLQQVLPACIHEQKKLWNIAWKYLALRVLCEVLLFVLTSAEVSYALLKWPYFIIVQTLFLGFVCAAANATGLWVGIKTLVTKHVLKWVGFLVAIKLLIVAGGVLLGMGFVHSVWLAAVNVAVVYTGLVLLKQKAN